MLFRRFPLAVTILVLGSCAVPAPPPPPPAPTVRPAPAAPPPVPASSDWRDWPLTPGDWRYAREGATTVARYGTPGSAPLLTLTCAPANRQIRLTRAGAATGVTVRTSSALRTLALTPTPEGNATTILAGTDPLFEAMGFSRGRFVIQQEGAPALVVPAWAEILRVAEDCRA